MKVIFKSIYSLIDCWPEQSIVVIQSDFKFIYSCLLEQSKVVIQSDFSIYLFLLAGAINSRHSKFYLFFDRLLAEVLLVI
jgi:hypothetical protein